MQAAKCLHTQDLASTSVEAASLSTFSGLLAGFLFASILIVVSTPPNSRHVKELSSEILGFLVGFTLLLLSTFLYIPVAGAKFRPEQEIEFLISDIILGLAVVSVFLNLCWIFVSYEVEDTVVSGAKFVFGVVVFLVCINLGNTTVITFQNLAKFIPEYQSTSLKDWILFASIFGFPIVFWLAGPFINSDRLVKRLNLYRKSMLLALVYSVALSILYVYIMTPWSISAIELCEKGQGQKLPSPFPSFIKYVFCLSVGFLLGALSLSLPPPSEKF